MDLIYQKTQTDLADALIYRIDRYWNLELEEDRFISEIKELVSSNQNLLVKDGHYTAIIQHRLGKKRLALLEKVTGKESSELVK